MSGVVNPRALAWVAGNDTGLSSLCIWRTMMGVPEPDRWAGFYPLDPDDFNRCRLLLNEVPEWRERLPEMAKHGPVWAALVERWDDIEASFMAEYGDPPRWKGTTRDTYDLMASIIHPIEDAQRYGDAPTPATPTDSPNEQGGTP